MLVGRGVIVVGGLLGLFVLGAFVGRGVRSSPREGFGVPGIESLTLGMGVDGISGIWDGSEVSGLGFLVLGARVGFLVGEMDGSGVLGTLVGAEVIMSLGFCVLGQSRNGRRGIC